LGTVLEDQETKLVHFIGKDNIFHCVIFPAMLKAEGSYILRQCSCNEFLNLEGNKLSTSKNWAVWYEYLLNQQDVLRYALTSNAPKLRIMILPGKIFRREIIMN
jgi:methionyl-tRNA synthetase